MKKCKMIIFPWLFLIFLLPVRAEVAFGDYFLDQTMRIDYYHMADKTNEYISVDKIYQQGEWAGSRTSHIDPFNNGRYYIKVYDESSGVLIYSRGFNSYCAEYVTTDMAADGIRRTYHETALIPFPKNKIKFAVERRNRNNLLEPIFSRVVDPQSVEIIKESLIEGVTVFEARKYGPAHKKVDLAFIAEGYTRSEEEKFRRDLERIMAEFFKKEPYKSYKEAFNIYGVFKASRESGPDEPLKGIFRNTAVGASFNALGLPRYMLTEENRALRDIAAHVPYDAVIIMVNSPRFGGGGIYNSYCCFTSDNKWSTYLLIHEFGHSFAGLADEYYASTVSYNEFYPTGIEPTEPNITALLEPKALKWKHLVKKDTPIPTPWGKETFDKLRGKKRAIYLQEKLRELKDTVGAFEGAGYTSKGLYRPMIDCIMFSKSNIPYCKVCEDGIVRMIKYYTE